MSTVTSLTSEGASIEQLVQQYMAYENRALTKIEEDIAELNTKKGVFSDLKSQLDTLENAADKLADTSSDSVFNSVQVSSSDTDYLTVSAGSNSAQGQYTFRIKQLATSTIMKSSSILNTNPSTESASQVVAGSGVIDIDELWADAGFDNTPDGEVVINDVLFTLSDYDTVEEFMDAVSSDATANANIFYNDETDRFVVESTDGGNLSISENGSVGFFSEANIDVSSVMSSASVDIDTSQAWADAGFGNTPDGTVTVNGVEFTLTNYATVDDFVSAVNSNGSANATLAYDDTLDRFFIQSDDGGDITISENGTNGFFTEAGLTTGTLETAGDYTTNDSGLNSSALLSETNFDNKISAGETGSFKINGVVIEWDADSDSLASLIADINSSDAGVTAFYDESVDKVVFTSETTGSEEIEWEDVEGSFLSDALKLDGVSQDVGQDALFTINSTDSSDEITKSSNTFDINGLSFTLKATTVENGDYADAETTSVTVNSDRDESALREAVSDFLKEYNDVMDYIKTKTAVDISTYTRGALTGETVYTNLRSNIMSIMLGQVEGMGDDEPSYFAEIGITLDENLHAAISDSEDFSDWLTDDPQAVADLFNSENGIATQIMNLLEPFTERYGIIDDRKDMIDEKIEYYNDRMDRVEAQLAIKEEYYRTQFTTLQSLLNQVTYQQETLNSLMSSLSSISLY